MATTQSSSSGTPESITSSVQNTTEAIKREGERLATDVKSSVGRLAEKRKDATADYLAALSSALECGATELRDQGYDGTAGLLTQSAQEIDRFGHKVSGRPIEGLLDDVEEFARRRPVLFFGTSFLAGFALMRLYKNSGSRENQERNRASSSGSGNQEA